MVKKRIVEWINEFRGTGRVVMVVGKKPRDLKEFKKYIEIWFEKEIAKCVWFYRTDLRDGTIIRYRDEVYNFNCRVPDAIIYDKRVDSLWLTEMLEKVSNVRSFEHLG